MPWWEIALLVYLIPTPFTEIATIAVLMVARDEWRERRRVRTTTKGTILTSTKVEKNRSDQRSSGVL